MKAPTRRNALRLALGAGAALTIGNARAQMYRRPGVAFGTHVSITLEARDAEHAERAFAAAFAEIRHIDRLASLTREDGELFRLNRDGFLANPDPSLIEMLAMAQTMHKATAGAFDVTIQPLWLALDAAARRGTWPSEQEIADIKQRVGQSRVRFDDRNVRFETPGMAITLNSLARGLAADRVAAALTREGVERAFFDTDVLGARGEHGDGRPFRVGLRHPRDAARSLGEIALQACLATSGDYQYFWSSDYSRNHIIDPRRGESPSAFSSVSVLAASGLTADALSTAAFLLPPEDAAALVAAFGAEAAFIDKAGRASAAAGFPVVWRT